jgi:cysteine-rich repeat protein
MRVRLVAISVVVGVVSGLALLASPTSALAVCGDAIPDPGEQCDDGNLVDGDCCSSLCQLEPATTICRPAAGICDVAETCTGTDPTCPPDAKSTAVCRNVAGACDVPETCDGLSDQCPPDQFLDATTPCRPSAGDCDVAEFCTGTDAACPPNVKSTAVCRPATTVCDVAESCDGVSDVCPPDGFAPASLVCRPAAQQCDAAEFCTGTDAFCPPDAPAPEDTPCDDANACTRTDTCQSGACVGANPVVCTALDACHVAGTCAPATGLCSNPARPDGTTCDDADTCTTHDSCQGGLCVGLAIPGCCTVDADCDDGIACTADRCVARTRTCSSTPDDTRCGPGPECAQLMCSPGDAAADADGCIPRAIDEGGYCAEDGDPCTIDACRTGACLHQEDGSGPRCVALVTPYRTALALLARTRDLESSLRAAQAPDCTVPGTGACEIVAGASADRLVALLGSTELDLGTVALALAGRLADSSSASAQRDPVVRARLALGLLADTPANLRGFLATLAQARGQRAVAPAFARARRAEGRALLRGAAKLRRQLQKIVARRQSFAR